MQRNIIKSLAVICTSMVVCASVQAQRLTWLGVQLDGRTYERSEAKDVSNNGIVVGYFSRANGNNPRAFVWIADRGLRSIPLFHAQAFENAAISITADGRWIVGMESVSLQMHALRWHSDTLQANRLNELTFAKAHGIADDGNTTVGIAMQYQNYFNVGFITTSANTSPLHPFQGGRGGWAHAVNGRGTRAVGVTTLQDGTNRATLWQIDSNQAIDLGGSRSQANSLSDDARVIVGSSNFVIERPYAVRWVDGNGPLSIHPSNTGDSVAYDVSSDGRIIVGKIGNSAFMWTEQEGMVNLNVRFASLLSSGSSLTQANAISKNGQYIVGFGIHQGKTQAFVLELPSCTVRNGDVDGNGCVDDADLLQVLFNFGATGANTADLNCDTTVDDADLLIVLFNFGSGC